MLGIPAFTCLTVDTDAPDFQNINDTSVLVIVCLGIIWFGLVC